MSCAAPLSWTPSEPEPGEEEGFYLNSRNGNVSSTTARQFFYGNEYYGTFFRALFTLFQAMLS